MTNLEWLLSMPVKDIEKRYYREECTLCIYDGSGECDKRSCIEGKLKWLNAEHVPKIKPCPFCGGKAIVDKNQNSVSCADCHMGTPWTDSIEDAIKTWNRRIGNGKVDGD